MTETKTRRPRAEHPETLTVRVGTRRRQLIDRAADLEGLSSPEWARRVLDDAVERVLTAGPRQMTLANAEYAERDPAPFAEAQAIRYGERGFEPDGVA
jgi:uncharacterized protein (DUF1778 family)